MQTESQTFPRAAKTFTIVALACLALPVLMTFTGGYVEGLGLFIVLYLLAAIAATIAILIASLKRQWKERGQGWKLLAALYGVPFLLILLLMSGAARR